MPTEEITYAQQKHIDAIDRSCSELEIVILTACPNRAGAKKIVADIRKLAASSIGVMRGPDDAELARRAKQDKVLKG